ncbi:MAG: glycosyltransferase family 4 protein, partial [Athalassotoga sp.]
YIISNFGGGGAEKIISDLAIRINKENYEPLIVSLGNYDKSLTEKWDKILNFYNIEHFIFDRTNGAQKIKTILNLRKIIKIYKPDIIHTNYCGSIFYSALSSTGIKVKMINTFHSTSGFSLKDKIILRIFRSKFKHFVCVSKSVKEVIEKSFKIKSEDISVIYNGIDLKAFDPNQNEKKVKDKLVFLSIGRLSKEKGFDILLNALSKLNLPSNVYFKIAGDGSLKQDLKEMIIKKGLEGQVKLLGNVNHDNIPQLLWSANVYVMPSLFEGFGISLIEAMASGKPLILSDIDSFKEILGLYDLNFLNGFAITKFGVMFEVGNSEALVNALKWMLENKDKWETFGKNSYERAKEFDISKFVQKYELLYRKLIQKYEGGHL